MSSEDETLLNKFKKKVEDRECRSCQFLLKYCWKKNQKIQKKKEKSKKLLAAGALVGGGTLAAKSQADRLAGTVTRYHATSKKNVPSIMKQGLLAAKAENPHNLTNRVLSDVPMEKKKGLVYTSKSKLGAYQAAGGAMQHGVHTDPKVLKLKFNYDDVSKMPKIKNPELRGKDIQHWWDDHVRGLFNPKYNELNRLQKSRVNQTYNMIDKGTHIFQGDISPEHIVGSKNYKKQTDFKRWKEYVKKNPKRFLKGAGIAGAGAAAVGTGGYLAYNALKKDKAKKSAKK